MKKEKIREIFLKLRGKGFSFDQCKEKLKKTYNYDVTVRTLQRWDKRFKKTNWNLKDYSKRPKTIHYKVSPKIKKTPLLTKDVVPDSKPLAISLVAQYDVMGSIIRTYVINPPINAHIPNSS